MTQLYEKMNEAKNAAEDFAGLAGDPFKAPEQIIEAIMPLQAALFHLAVEWAITTRKDADDN